MTLFLVAIGVILAGGVAAVAARGARALHLPLLLTGCALGVTEAVRVLAGGRAPALVIPSALPGGAWHLAIDPLSAVFLLAVLVVGALCAVYGSFDADPHHESRLYQLAFAALIASIAMVIVARDVVLFLSAWEVMAISSYLLIVTHHEDRAVRRAGLIYLAATHTATLALFAMFAIWAGHAPDWTFVAFAAASPSLGRGAIAAILLLALAGFGFKAGGVPLHFWLPPAHAAAPSHVSALMSGIVIKTGIYGLLRVLLLLGGAPAWWGWLVFAIGIASGVLGVLWALAQHDIKRLLAYHSVENIGIILMGIGIGVLGVTHDAPPVAVLGFAGALLHTVNHALFKSLLFLGAGVVYRVTGTRNMEEMGGLAKRLPFTWLAFAIGAAAIVGLPPFNGFVSEWLVYLGMFHGADQVQPLRLALLGVPGLALIGALALACFAKVSGMVFLGVPRSARAAHGEERRGVYVPTLLFAVACTVLGLFPALGIALVRRAAAQFTASVVPPGVTSGAWAISMVALVTVGLVAVLWLLRNALTRGVVRREETWACGYDAATPRMQYTASSFAAPLLAVFGELTGVHVQRTAAAFHSHARDLVLDGIAFPAWNAMHRFALRFRVAQHGRLHFYLLYVLAALIGLLAYLAVSLR